MRIKGKRGEQQRGAGLALCIRSRAPPRRPSIAHPPPGWEPACPSIVTSGSAELDSSRQCNESEYEHERVVAAAAGAAAAAATERVSEHHHRSVSVRTDECGARLSQPEYAPADHMRSVRLLLHGWLPRSAPAKASRLWSNVTKDAVHVKESKTTCVRIRQSV